MDTIHTSCCRSPTYELINDEQKKILREFYDNGMTTAASSMEGIIKEAASKASMTVDRVKVRYCLCYCTAAS